MDYVQKTNTIWHRVRVELISFLNAQNKLVA
jgi:hypothetical protein